MADRENTFARNQASRSSIRTQNIRRNPMTPPNNEAISPKLQATTVDNHLKQWELVEDGKGLQVVEKRPCGIPMANPGYGRTPVFGRRTIENPTDQKIEPNIIDPSLEEKLKVFKDSKIVQPIRITRNQTEQSNESKIAPISLDLILKQRKGSTIESTTDMLQRLEQHVKTIEMNTMVAAARTRQLENSSDFEPEIQLRYREHEDLLKDVTDDEAEG